MDDVQIDAEAPEEEPTPVSAPGEAEEKSEAAEEKVVFDERQQAKVNELIGEKVAKTHEERNRGDALQQRLDEIEAAQPKPLAPEIPPMPDTDLLLDDPAKYNAEIETREKAISARAVFDANEEFVQKQGAFQAFEAQQKQEVKERQEIESYTQAATSFGIDREKMVNDANVVAQVLSLPVKDFIMQDPQGPLITSHLRGNAVELDLLSSMSPAKAAIHIENKIKPKLSGVRKSTQAPAPVEIVDGGGSPEREPDILRRAEFK